MAKHDLYIDRWTPSLRRAVMRVRPEFFAWPSDRQTRYRIALPEADRAALRSCLLDGLPGAGARPLPTPDDEDKLLMSLQHQFNEFLQPLVGLGDDAFFLNELLEKGISILDFETLRDYDEYDHASQERLWRKEDSAYRSTPYLGRLYGCWARVLMDGRLTYLTISMAAGAIFDRMQEASYDEIQRLIPHRHVSGPRDGEVEGEMFRWDVRTEAGGQEGLLEELQHRVWEYEAERWTSLQAEWAELGRSGAYILDNPAPDDSQDERNLEIVFTDPQALGQVRFETFMADTRHIERAAAELENAAATEIELMREFITRELDDLRQNFNPRVTRLRKRMKVLVHRQAFDTLTVDDDEQK